MSPSNIVQKLWNYCNVLRDDGMSYGDYVEQLTYLLFLKMTDERSRPPYNQGSPVLAGYDWHRIAPSLALPRTRERGFFGAKNCSTITATRWMNWASKRACSA